MDISKEEARRELAKLVEKYRSLTPAAIRKYSEADTRRIFVMPLFHALGWDVFSRDEVAEEVKASPGRVDYVFRLHGVSQFYLEAKALRAELSRPEYIKQAITYAYNKGITWAVLTDFEGLLVHNAQSGRLFINLSSDNYSRDFDDLWLLSRESLESNALNERAEKYGALPPRLGVEQRLFGQLRRWREELFTQLYHYNPHLTYGQIDEIIQRLFNRLIFIRTCEDRRIEDRVLLGTVHEWRSGGCKQDLIEALRGVFRYFDGYYDSDLFALHLVDGIFIESATVENIINGLYEIPGGMASYDFSLIDADVLGAVYEQYLGHVATVAMQRVKEAQARMYLGFPSEPTFELTAKKERRKARGIYYTPRFITDYIVRETVGRFLKERSYDETLKIKILDPACGSGSFLIRAYDELLNHHAYRGGKSVTELDQYERLNILIRNIFGVDLDQQAVEIACLNLLLRSLARREVLPSLADNVRQGNSLISGTEEELKSCFGDKWREKKPFNWEREFNDIMANGGFDVVIGNPPYVRTQTLDKSEADYFKQRYVSATGHYDVYVLFLERALSLLRQGGRVGLILPSKFFQTEYGRGIRGLISQEGVLEQVVNFGPHQIFEESTTYTCLLFLKKERMRQLKYSLVKRLHSPAEQLAKIGSREKCNGADLLIESVEVPPPSQQPWLFTVSATSDIVGKLFERGVPLREMTDHIFVGPQTDADKVFILTGPGDEGGALQLHSKSTNARHTIERASVMPLLSGQDVKRYGFPQRRQWIIFPYEKKGARMALIPATKLEDLYPHCFEYLNANRALLETRPRLRDPAERWVAFGQEKNLSLQRQAKLCVPRLCRRLTFLLDEAGEWCQDNVDVCGVILKKEDKEQYYFALGLLNSRAMDFYFRQIEVHSPAIQKA